MSAIREAMALPSGTVIGRFRLGRVSAVWGFYLVYEAEDPAGQTVLVQELLPEELVVRGPDGAVAAGSPAGQDRWALARECYLAEGRSLAAMIDPGVQKVLEVLETKGTAYWVLAPAPAKTLKGWRQDLGRAPTGAELQRWLRPLLAALEKVHGAGLRHLNLKPDTIRIAPSGDPVLTHFSGARQAIARRSHEALAVTTGYSSPEQYDAAQMEDARSDLYSVAAVLYRAISGEAPPDAEARLAGGPAIKLVEKYGGAYEIGFLSAIEEALALSPANRPRDIAAWRTILGIPVEAGGPGAIRRRRTRLGAALAAVFLLAGLGWWLWPDPTPLKDKIVQKEEQKEQQETAEPEEEAQEKEKLQEEQKKAEAEQLAAEKEAARKAEEEKQALAEVEQKAKAAEEAARNAAEKKQAETEAAEQAAQALAERKEAAQKAAAEAARKAAEAKAKAEVAAKEKARAEQVAKDAAAERTKAEKIAAEKTLTREKIDGKLRAAMLAAQEKAKAKADAEAEKAAAEKQAQDRAATEKRLAEKQAAEKQAAEQKAQEQRQAAVEEEKRMKAAAQAERAAAAQKAAAEKQAAEKRAQEMAAEKERKETPEKKETQSPSNGGAASGYTGGRSGSGLAGLWEATESGGKMQLTIFPDGRYVLSTAKGEEVGDFMGLSGIINLINDNGSDPTESTYKYRGLGTLVTEGYLGKREWKRVGIAEQKGPPKPQKKP